jgi:hypothetical protein
MRQQPKDLQAAQQLGEQLFQLPLGRRDLGELRELAERFPGQWRLAWLRFQAELEVPDYAAAAHTAARLAGHLRSLE